jgi:hypothetical protein
MRSKLGKRVRMQLFTLGALWLSLGLVSVVAADSEAVIRRKDTLVLFGSSSVNDSFGHLISEDFERLGFSVTRHGYASAGLARPDFRDLRDALAEVPLDSSVSTVLFYVGANDTQRLWLRPEERAEGAGEKGAWVKWDDERWSSVYSTRVADMIRSVCARGVKHAILLAPVDVTNAMRQARLDRVRRIEAEAAALSVCGQYVPTAGDSAVFRSVEQPLRADDGFHMTHVGAARVWQRVRPMILSLLDEP